MNWRQFFAAVIQSAMWPITVITVGAMYRRQLVALLGKGIRRAKVGPLEVEWDVTLGKARSDLARGEVQAAQQGETLDQEASVEEPEGPEPEAEGPEPEAEGPEPEAEGPEPEAEAESPEESAQDKNGRRSPSDTEMTRVLGSMAQDNQWPRLLNQAISMIDVDPRSAILITLLALEYEVGQLAAPYREDNPARHSLRENTSILVAERWITPATAAAIGKLERLRNLTVHGKRSATSEQAREFIEVAENVRNALLRRTYLTHDDHLVWSGEVARALDRVSMNIAPTQAGSVYDFIATTAVGQTLVFLKYRQKRLFTLKDLSEVISELRSLSANGLVITNAPLSPSVRTKNGDILNQNPRVEAVTWNGEHDDVVLARALTRLAQLSQ